ncbi:hypothetical protein BN1723_016558, partial [Verticillium longisporum]
MPHSSNPPHRSAWTRTHCSRIDLFSPGHEGPSPFPADGQNQVCEVFRDFVRVHQALLNTIIGKSSFLSGTPFTAPITEVLRTIEGGVDKLAFGIIDLVPTCKKGLESDKKELDASFKETFKAL